MTDQHAELASGLKDRYVLARELGHGGMATVWLAQDVKHDRPVALKVLHPGLAQSLGPARFQREIRVAARLQHPHILPVFDSGETAGQLWFTMPVIDGQSLRDRLRRLGALPVDEALRITREAAQALQYAHDQGVVHRDIKPENILLTKDGNTLVADFGIARAPGGDAELQHLTETGLAIGTPAYMSPEQAMGEREVDARTDIYSLATVCFEMITGGLPYKGATGAAVITARYTGPIPSVRDQHPEIPPDVDQAIQRGLALSPDDRWGSMREFARGLGAGTSGASAITALHARKAGPLRRRALTTVFLAGLAIGIGVLFAWKRPRAPEAGGDKRLAVLPFENLGPQDQGYFADGVTDEIRGKLTALPGLRVTARSSSMGLKGDRKPEEIAQDLGVQYLLTGTVRWEKDANGVNRVKVSPELINATTGDAVWQQPFDAELTGVFEVQAAIAARVAEALGLALGEPARQELKEKPTTSVAAYDAYLRGQSFAERARLNVEPKLMTLAQQMYEEAIAQDSSFGIAWARLSGVHLYLARRDPADSSHLVKARQAAERAVALAPKSAEAHIAMGDYLWTANRDKPAAMVEYEIALKSQPRDPELLSSIGWNQNDRGQRDSALANIRLAQSLDPRSAERALDLAQIQWALGHYAQADSAYDRAIALAPDQYHAYWEKSQVQLDWRGDVAAARRVMQEAETRIGRVEFVKKMCVACFDWTGPLAPDYERVLDQLSLDGFSPVDSSNYYIARASRAYMHHDAAGVRTFADSARVVIEGIVRAKPDAPYFHGQLALVYAALGRRADAVKQDLIRQDLRRARADTTDLAVGTADRWSRALVLLGEYDAAIDSLQSVLADTAYHWTSRAALRVDPFWDPVRKNPKFQRLVNGR